MDGCAARVAARESGDERVKSLDVSLNEPPLLPRQSSLAFRSERISRHERRSGLSRFRDGDEGSVARETDEDVVSMANPLPVTEFEQQIKGLVDQLFTANLHFQIGTGLRKSWREYYQQLVQAHVF